MTSFPKSRKTTLHFIKIVLKIHGKASRQIYKKSYLQLNKAHKGDSNRKILREFERPNIDRNTIKGRGWIQYVNELRRLKPKCKYLNQAISSRVRQLFNSGQSQSINQSINQTNSCFSRMFQVLKLQTNLFSLTHLRVRTKRATYLLPQSSEAYCLKQINKA